MSYFIEALSIRRERQARLSPLQMEAQISAIKDLVTVTHKQLVVANKIDGNAFYDWPIQEHRFDAFFFIPEFNGVMEITSLGSPDDAQSGALYLTIYYKNNKRNIEQLVGLLTVRVPEMVDEQEALRLSGYNPEQLLQIAELVRTANHPITAETYESYF